VCDEHTCRRQTQWLWQGATAFSFTHAYKEKAYFSQQA